MALPIKPPPPGHFRLRFVASRGNWMSWAIRAWTTDDSAESVSHVEAVMPDGSTIGAYAEGVARHWPGSDTTSTMQRHVDIPDALFDRAKAVRYLESRIGQPYDFRGILGEAVHRDIHMPGAKYCSALQTLACSHWYGGLFAPLARPAHEIDPEMLLTLCSSHAGVIVGKPEFS